MFRIRKEQMEFFAEKTRRAFVAKMTDYVANEFPERAARMPKGELSKWVEEATGRSTKWGIRMEPDVAQFILLALLLGLDVEEKQPWAKEVLSEKRLSGGGKVRLLIRRAKEKNIPGLDGMVLSRNKDVLGEGGSR